MNEKALEIILNQFKNGNISIDETATLISELFVYKPTYIPIYVQDHTSSPNYITPQKFEVICQ